MRKQRWQAIKEKLSPRIGSSASVPGELFLLLTQPFAVIVTRTPMPPTSQTPASQSPQPSQNTSRPPDVYGPSTAPVVPLGQDWAKTGPNLGQNCVKTGPKRHERGQYQRTVARRTKRLRRVKPLESYRGKTRRVFLTAATAARLARICSRKLPALPASSGLTIYLWKALRLRAPAGRRNLYVYRRTRRKPFVASAPRHACDRWWTRRTFSTITARATNCATAGLE